MSRLIKIGIVIILISKYSVLLSQSNRQQEIDFLIKVVLYQEAGGTLNYTSDYYLLGDFLKLNFNIDTLEEEGLSDFLFLEINPRYENPHNINFSDGPFLLDNCTELIVAVHKRGRSIYKLKGFRNNDFQNFIRALKFLNYPYVNSKKQFVKNYFVEKLDLKCLYKVFSTYSIEKGKYKCLNNCSDGVF